MSTEDRPSVSAVPLPESYRPGTLVDLFLGGLAADRPAAARTRRPEGGWTSHASAELADRVRAIALGLRAAGLGSEDRVAIVSHTRLEWALADWGLVMARVASVPVYPVLPADQVRYIVADAGAKAAFAADQKQLDKLASVAHELPSLETVIVFDAVDVPAGRLRVITLDELEAAGRAAPDALAATYESHARSTRPEDLATLIYTSGTTGDPKGVMLTHENFHSNVILTGSVFPLDSGDCALSLLPLAHVFERTVGHYLMWHAGVSIAYAESTNTVARDMREVSPTIMAAVPRVFEKVLERAEETAREAGGAKPGIFDWARRVGELRADRELAGERPSLVLRFQAKVADRLVFAKLRQRTGGRVRYFASGGAPLPKPVARFFFAAGLPIIEGYGLTETSPVLTFNRPEAIRLGTVGLPIPGTEIRIASDGEILARGPQIMRGYFGKPEATDEAIDADGWLHTGDVGELGAEGHLRITDRKKDLIITAYGKNIAPQPIEARVKRDPLIAEAVMIGDQRKFPIMLVVPELTVLRSRLDGVADASDADMVRDERAIQLLAEAVRKRCEDCAHYELPREVLPVEGPFTIEGGELTPTLKVKRRVVERRYADEIEALYQRAEEAMTEREREAGGA